LKKITIYELCKEINASLLRGDENNVLTSINSLENATENEIVFINQNKFIGETKKTCALTCLTSQNLAPELQNFKNVIVSENPYLSFALATRLFASAHIKDEPKNINSHVSNSFSFISETALVGKNVQIGHNCHVGDHVVIGDNTTIENNVVIYDSVKIGNNVIISSGAVIGSQGFGFAQDSEKWVQIKHLGGVVIHDNVNIGSNTTIDRGTLDPTIIGKDVIIDNLVHIAHNVKIGNSTAIAAMTGIAGSTTIGQRCMIGGMVGIFGHLTITDDVIITPKSNVYRSIKKPGRYASLFPLVEFRVWKKISLLLSKLDKIKSLYK